MAADLTGEAALERRVARRVFLIMTLFLIAIGVLNALGILTEAQRASRVLDPRVPFILELTSVLAMVALAPLVILFERRVPFTAETWRSALFWHVLGSIVFSLLHIALFIALRTVAFASILGMSYSFFTDLPTDLLYEYRKDIFPYSVLILMLGLQRSLEEHRREAEAARADARQTGKLTLKAGGRTIFLDAASLDWASAAGNYVEIRANGATHLARISLAALEQLLSDAGVDVARVHRSHLVNRAKVREIAPVRDGDFTIRMADGSELRGSRRYRQELA
ncbi:LytTR family DNA-binding domain-containing protein [Devosia sp. LjRoot16]|uniref:LytTR family DNA-binding domain-containing protein n=1 Tax=Devosia sp. LjRoot16 TaxID=3342271 RepID=UPI003ECDDB2D